MTANDSNPKPTAVSKAAAETVPTVAAQVEDIANLSLYEGPLAEILSAIRANDKLPLDSIPKMLSLLIELNKSQDTLIKQQTAKIQQLEAALLARKIEDPKPVASVPTVPVPRAKAPTTAVTPAEVPKPNKTDETTTVTASFPAALVDETFLVVHLAGFNLQRKWPRETVTAVLEANYGLTPFTIVNVSPMAPELQELHIFASRLPDLAAAVAKTDGALLLSASLDPSKPGYETADESVIAEAKARFCKRLDGDIARLSASKSRRLRDLAAFLISYKNDGTRRSTPREITPSPNDSCWE